MMLYFRTRSLFILIMVLASSFAVVGTVYGEGVAGSTTYQQAQAATSTVYYPVRVKSLGRVSKVNQAKVVRYLKKKFGAKFYKNNITLRTDYSESSQVCPYRQKCRIVNHVYFTYRTPALICGSGGPVSTTPHALQLEVTMTTKGVVTEYTGPPKPYQFAISQAQAETIARQSGLSGTLNTCLSFVNNKFDLQWEVGNDTKRALIDIKTGDVASIGDIETCKDIQCPICLAADTEIAIAGGNMRVQEITVGVPIWSIDRYGKKVLVKVSQVSSVPVQQGIPIVHLTLEDGRVLYVSPNHPMISGEPVKMLQPGDVYDGSVVKSLKYVPYQADKTYDILPDSDTGFYWANGILVGSTLK